MMLRNYKCSNVLYKAKCSQYSVSVRERSTHYINPRDGTTVIQMALVINSVLRVLCIRYACRFAMLIGLSRKNSDSDKHDGYLDQSRPPKTLFARVELSLLPSSAVTQVC